MANLHGKKEEFIYPNSVPRFKAERRVRAIIRGQFTKAERALNHAAEVPKERRKKYLGDAQKHLLVIRRDINLAAELWASQRLAELDARLLELS